MAEKCVKFYLAELVPFTLNVVLAPPRQGGVSVSAASLPVSWTIHNIRRVGGGNAGKKISKKLRSTFQNRTLSWRVRVVHEMSQAFRTLGEMECELEFDSFPHAALQEILGQGAFLQVEMLGLTCGDDLSFDQFPFPYVPVSALVQDEEYRRVVFTETKSVPIELEQPAWPIDLRVFRGRMNLILISGPGPAQMTPKEELLPELVIVCGNGAEVKCPRSFMMAHSPVFQAMFQADMLEAKTRKVEMTDMSEEGVKALLAYLYHGDLSKAEESCAVAVELLKAGHKYGISGLEKDIRKLLLGKEDAWYEVDVAMKLFLFIHNLEEGLWEGLKKKAVGALKKSTPDLTNSPMFQQLFWENPEAALRFCLFALEI